jgi:hypothetical protein
MDACDEYTFNEFAFACVAMCVASRGARARSRSQAAHARGVGVDTEKVAMRCEPPREGVSRTRPP